jgi:hypothetical protein
VQATLWVLIKQTSGSLANWLGVDQYPPFQLWFGKLRTIVAAAREALLGLKVAIKLPMYPTLGQS